MTKEQIAEALKKQRVNDPVWDAVAHVLAFRQRNRSTLTTKGLWLKMRKEGFNYNEGSYAPVVKFLAGLGIGKLQTTKRGRAVGLKDIRVPLQQIGVTACGPEGGDSIPAIPPPRKPSPVLKTASKVSKAEYEVKEPLVVSLRMYGHAVKVVLPHSISAYDTVRIITKLNQFGGGHE